MFIEVASPDTCSPFFLAGASCMSCVDEMKSSSVLCLRVGRCVSPLGSSSTFDVGECRRCLMSNRKTGRVMLSSFMTMHQDIRSCSCQWQMMAEKWQNVMWWQQSTSMRFFFVSAVQTINFERSVKPAQTASRLTFCSTKRHGMRTSTDARIR